MRTIRLLVGLSLPLVVAASCTSQRTNRTSLSYMPDYETVAVAPIQDASSAILGKVVFEESTVKVSPPSGDLRVTVVRFTEGTETTYDICVRWWLHDVEPLKTSPLGIPILRASVQAGYGRIDGFQYYVLQGDRLVLVRLEDAQGVAQRNTYESRDLTVGARLPRRSASQWQAMVCGDDSVAILEALTWLGGTHRDLDTECPYTSREPAAQVRMVQAVLDHPDVQARLAVLGRSDNPWIRDAAAFAAAPVFR